MAPRKVDAMEMVQDAYVCGHLRSGRYTQRERPAVTLPGRLTNSRYGQGSTFHLSWEPIMATAAAATLARLIQND